MNIGFFKHCPLFAHLDAVNLAIITASMEIQNYAKNKFIFHEGQQAGNLFIVCDGQAKVFKSTTEGKEHILHIMYKYDMIAEAPMFAGDQYPANCVAMNDVTLFALPRIKLITIIKTDPQIALNILALQAKRLREFTYKIEQLSLKTTEQKFLNFLLQSATIENGFTVASINNISMQELADYLGTARENLSRTINKLILNKKIIKHKRGFILTDTVQEAQHLHTSLRSNH